MFLTVSYTAAGLCVGRQRPAGPAFHQVPRRTGSMTAGRSTGPVPQRGTLHKKVDVRRCGFPTPASRPGYAACAAPPPAALRPKAAAGPGPAATTASRSRAPARRLLTPLMHGVEFICPACDMRTPSLIPPIGPIVIRTDGLRRIQVPGAARRRPPPQTGWPPAARCCARWRRAVMGVERGPAGVRCCRPSRRARRRSCTHPARFVRRP